jgi:hypothetical protein
MKHLFMAILIGLLAFCVVGAMYAVAALGAIVIWPLLFIAVAYFLVREHQENS